MKLSVHIGWVLACWMACAPLARAQSPGRVSASTALYGAGVKGPQALLGDRFDLVDIDTLFYIENRGLTRVFVTLNGHAFKLVTQEEELGRSANAFLIPRHGEITLHIGTYIHPDPGNWMELRSQGPADAGADIVVGDLLLPGQKVAYAVTGLVPFPERFTLLQGYPNPFRDRTRIAFTIPEARTAGLPTRLEVFDAVGRRVRVLVDEPYFPGRFSVTWDGTSQQGRLLPGGVYFCRIIAGEFQETIRLVLVR